MNTLLGHALKPVPYQEGGPVSAGMAALRRLKSKQAAANYAQETLDDINKKSGSSNLWGTIGGLAGGYGLPLLAGALGFTPVGLPLALLAGLGTAGGAYFGKKKGYGEDVDIDEDMRYGGSQFLGEGGLDKQKLGQEDFTGAFVRDSALKGLTSALTAGLAKGGGSYGKAAKFGQGLTDKGATGAALIPSYAQSFAMDTGLDTAGVAGEGALSGTGSILDMGGYGDLSSSISVTPVESGFTPSLSIPTEARNYGSVSDALNAPIFEGLKDEAIAMAPVDSYSSGLAPGFTTPNMLDVDMLPDQDVSDFNFGDEFIEMVEKNSPLYYDSPKGRQELGLTPKDYFKNLIKDSRERTKERLFPQDSFNFNNLLSMLGSN